jgi:hypothetical protein
MPKTYRLTGLPEGAADVANQELRFSLSVARDAPLAFVGKIGVVTQIISALGRILMELRIQLEARGAGMASVNAEEVAAAHIQRERWRDVVLLQLITPAGVPYTFALSQEASVDISARLKIESAKSSQRGNA